MSSKFGNLNRALKSSNDFTISSKLGNLNRALKSSNAVLNVSRRPVNTPMKRFGKSEKNLTKSSMKGSFLNLSNRFVKKSPKRLGKSEKNLIRSSMKGSFLNLSKIFLKKSPNLFGKSSKNLNRLSNDGNFTLRFFRKSKNRRSPLPRPRSTSPIKFTIFPRRSSPFSRNFNIFLNLARMSSNFVLNKSRKPLKSFISLSKPFANAPAIASARFFKKFRKLFSSPLPNPNKAFRMSDNV